MELWRELHLRALNYKGDNDMPYLLEFANRIPVFNSTCKCKEEWMIWVRQNPPVFGPNDEYFEWTVAGHNFVSKLLSKPEMSVEEAKKYYQSLSQ